MANSFAVATSPRIAGVVVGAAFLISVVIVTLVDDFLLANFVVPGDTAALARDIEANPQLLLFASVGYISVLVLDAVIGLGLFVVFRPVNKWLAAMTGALRLLYAGALMGGVLALLLQVIDVYGYATIKLVGYVFFAFHIFVLGCLAFVSGYIPRTLGALLVIASFSYAVFFIDIQLPDPIQVLAMLTMAIAEIALCVWLILKRNSLPEQ